MSHPPAPLGVVGPPTPRLDGDLLFPLEDARAATRSALEIAAVTLAITLISVFFLISVGVMFVAPGRIDPGILGALLPLAAAALAAWRLPVPHFAWRVAIVGALCTTSLILLTFTSAHSPGLAGDGTASLALNVASVIVVAIGALLDVRTRGALGALIGLLLAQGVIHLTAPAIGLPRGIDIHPVLIAGCLIAGFTFVPIARARGRRGTTALTAAEQRSRMRQVREQEAGESIALLHDTILNELAVIAHRAPGPLDADELARLAASLDSSVLLPLLRRVDDATFTNWVCAIGDAGGVRVHVEGDTHALGELPEHIASALRGALEQCLINVVRHARVDEAWVSVLVSAHTVSVHVIDEGVGFAPGEVPEDRLGLAESVRGRLERVGGSARVWSGAGTGTSVHLVVPRETA